MKTVTFLFILIATFLSGQLFGQEGSSKWLSVIQQSGVGKEPAFYLYVSYSNGTSEKIEKPVTNNTIGVNNLSLLLGFIEEKERAGWKVVSANTQRSGTTVDYQAVFIMRRD